MYLDIRCSIGVVDAQHLIESQTQMQSVRELQGTGNVVYWESDWRSRNTSITGLWNIWFKAGSVVSAQRNQCWIKVKNIILYSLLAPRSWLSSSNDTNWFSSKYWRHVDRNDSIQRGRVMVQCIVDTTQVTRLWMPYTAPFWFECWSSSPNAGHRLNQCQFIFW